MARFSNTCDHCLARYAHYWFFFEDRTICDFCLRWSGVSMPHVKHSRATTNPGIVMASTVLQIDHNLLQHDIAHAMLTADRVHDGDY